MLDTNITKNPDRLKQTMEITRNRTWEKYAEPFQMLDNVYCIATLFASQYLVKTEEGLVLIDAGWNQMAPFTIDSIHRLGFDPRDITHLFLTHGHYDHVGGARVIQEISHCKTYMCPGDMFFFTERRDLIYNEDTVPDFRVDELYDYKSTYSIGGVDFWTAHSPGHTPGTSTVFYKVKHGGEDVICAINGGSGLNGMSRAELEAKRLPVSLQKDYCDSMLAQAEMHVDCYTPAHQFGHDVIALKQRDDGTGKVFIDSGVWPRIMKSNYDNFMKAYGAELESLSQDK